MRTGAEMHVLLVEDDRELAHLFADALESAGYLVDEAFDAQHAYDTFARHPPPVVILDVGLPDESGLVLAGRMRRLAPHTEFVLCSAMSRLRVPVWIRAVLWKPFEVDEFLGAVELAAQAAGIPGVDPLER